jgi:hypothetical protein
MLFLYKKIKRSASNYCSVRTKSPSSFGINGLKNNISVPKPPLLAAARDIFSEAGENERHDLVSLDGAVKRVATRRKVSRADAGNEP